MKKLPIALLLLLSSTLFLLSGCALHIEDTNGNDNFTLQTITDQDIISGRSSVSVSSVGSSNNNRTTLKVEKLSGVKTLETLKSGSYEFTITFNVEQGNCRLVLCDGENILQDIDIGAKDKTFTTKSESGKLYLKIAGESAKFNIEYTYKKSS